MPETYNILNFEFHGRATAISGVQAAVPPPEPPPAHTDIHYTKPENIQKLVNELNTKSMIINTEIETAIKKKLPPEFSVQANIEFKAGSLEWEGLVAIFTWVGGVSAVLSLTDYLIRTIKYTVNMIVRDHAQTLAILENPETTVQAIEGTLTQVDPEEDSSQESNTEEISSLLHSAFDSQSKLLNRLTYGIITNAVISTAILIVFLIMISKWPA